MTRQPPEQVPKLNQYCQILSVSGSVNTLFQMGQFAITLTTGRWRTLNPATITTYVTAAVLATGPALSARTSILIFNTVRTISMYTVVTGPVVTHLTVPRETWQT